MTASAVPVAFDEARVDRFGFGRNWLDYQSSIDAAKFDAARTDIELWLGTTSLRGLRVLDLGSGSGLHSYCLHAMGATELVSFDYDIDSVQATKQLHARAGAPVSWTVMHGSVLDTGFLESLGTFDLVYSWGVLHHTGQMWQAIANAATRVRLGGTFFISIYAEGPGYAADLALKQRYHAASSSDKRRMEFEWITERYRYRAKHGLVPESWWSEGRERGMDAYCDLVDWLGGLPYEVATLGELTAQLRAAGIVPHHTRECPGDGGCHILVAARLSESALGPVASDAAAAVNVRVSWPAQAPVVWVGALDATHGPQRVVALAHQRPELQFVMVAAGFSKLDDASRRQLAGLAPNLRVVEHPSDAADIRRLLRAAGVVLHTSDSGPSAEWIATVASIGIPMVSLHDDASATLATSGCGTVADGDIDRIAAALDTLQQDDMRYARASLAAVSRRAPAHLTQQ